MEEYTINLFVEKVVAMREAQRLYFKTRTKEHLIDSKEKETSVDKWIRDYRQGLVHFYGENY